MNNAKLKNLIEELLKEEDALNPQTNAQPQSSDVKTLVKYIETKQDFLSKLERVSNGIEVTEFLSFILNKINDKVSGVNKNQLIKIINNRFK